ncbi:hypothetical protein LCGC14_0809740 [marine sediment metagenome]|uniref:Uncharacterized protein n=1 Tax=marine sediment metagenome TaxID=412755 RepID=A0A0F9S794_9ZZZZ
MALMPNGDITLAELIRRAKLNTPEKHEEFESLRLEAFDVAKRTFLERALSYNVDHACVEEMVFGPVSLASEIYKRAIRMTGVLSPERTVPLRPIELERCIDICQDLLNYVSWQYALATMVQISLSQEQVEKITRAEEDFTQHV